jgi:hypothetical protein
MKKVSDDTNKMVNFIKKLPVTSESLKTVWKPGQKDT